MRFDEDFVKMEFLSASVDNIPEEVIAALQHGPLSCKPRFVLYNEGEKKAEIDGADYTMFEKTIAANIPMMDD